MEISGKIVHIGVAKFTSIMRLIEITMFFGFFRA